MGRGSSKAGNAGGGITGQLEIAQRPIDASRTGENYRKLPATFQRNIEKNLQPSDVFKELATSKNPAEDEWTVGLKGIKRKQKVITSIKDGKINYTVKEKNKILLKTTDKNKVANKVAQYYNEELRKAGVR